MQVPPSPFPQLKQYMSDFEEERASREKMGEVVQLLQKREKDNEGEIIRLRKNVTELSTEKNELAFICEQLRQQIQVCTVLYCTVLYCTVVYSTVLYCTVLYCTVLYTQ